VIFIFKIPFFIMLAITIICAFLLYCNTITKNTNRIILPAMNVRLRKEHRNKEIDQGSSLYPVMQSILMKQGPLRRSIEHFWEASLDNKNRLLNVELVNHGSVNRVQVKPSEVFRIAIYKAAPRVVLVHNPTNGNLGILTPNEAGKNFTDHMMQAGKLLNIDVADHLVITETEYYSFKDRGHVLLLSKKR
jgi:DNA repair protein RadC